MFYTDFASLLAWATLVTGVVFVIYRCHWLKVYGSEEAVPKVWFHLQSFFPILLVVLIIRGGIAEPYRIPSGSMKPNLLEGDFVLVNKFTYGIRLPITGTALTTGHAPARGDILLFHHPEDIAISYIKRVVGLPGDEVAYRDKVVFINGQPQEQVIQNPDIDYDRGFRWSVMQHEETFEATEKPHAIFVQPDKPGQEMDTLIIPAGHYFVLGDNRDNSLDSRYWGLVPESLIIGKASYIWMSWDARLNNIRWSRIGQGL